MKLFKSTVVAVALVAGLSTFSVGVSASENQQVKPKSVSLQTDTSTQALRMSYEVAGIKNHKKTDSFYVDSKTDVTFTLLQWRGDGYRDGSPEVTYRLMNHNFEEVDFREVFGEITKEGFKLTFPNVPKGNYYIHIVNYSDFPISGYGYVEY
ncbi:hypothetical protein [Brevibacillus laterosporus]|uniref:Uncharacterized protein n=1 Tax=Brevibacillus laterosporus TaxID=1465 RepID=A0AAP3GCJ0_BRELA|nr:hypothetical protein [Brevibacillus laterosporus]MCR8982651.1 hypothetical protein [Brevibacillus laterosporus]MCZ0809807.1 hypothetical protein [Brevibacillus laterosporus]MCZ0828359.1 hypothetical protein [Brevibacillus laterosporus]MCZ0852369.1 hypothetical protein [Brevibacillus laterosporus]